ncbi:cell wall-binding repeat-containing protein [Clostridium thermarum]|uniref:cell wall-binding repeat-containing protein n=1 Tax=Clostridium thermarum TaxID=1716543 RepID=UPI0013D41E28|nr:cell wall-binding repeat-containing protein [Clostridium thermarum]
MNKPRTGNKFLRVTSLFQLIMFLMSLTLVQVPIKVQAETNTLIYNDFETGTGFTRGSGVTVTAATTENASEEGTKSLRMEVTGNAGWPNVEGNYIDVVPAVGSSMDASEYANLVFYVKDMEGNNGVEVTLTSEDGAEKGLWVDKGVKGEWVKLKVSLASFTGVDLTKIIKIRLGEYNRGTYYFDDIYFEKPQVNPEIPELAPQWFQNFEYGDGFAPARTVNTSLERVDTATAYGFNSVKLTMSNNQGGNWDNSKNSVIITPMYLAPSLDPKDEDKKYDYERYMDVSNYKYMIFYVKDTSGSNDVHITITDINNKSWDFSSDPQKTVKNEWVKMVIPLDFNKDIDFTKISEIRLGMYWDWNNVYYFDDVYFAQNEDDNPPNHGYTSLKLRYIDGTTVPYQNGIPMSSFEKQKSRVNIDLGGEWKKERVILDPQKSIATRDAAGIAAIEAEAEGRYTVDFDDSSWTSKVLPAPENELYADKAETKAGFEEYQGGVWYRRTFTVDEALEGKTLTLNFLGVNYFADVWVNGQYMGGHQGGYTPFAFDVTDVINYGAENVIAVRVDNSPWDKSFSNGEILPYVTSDWLNYTGMIRPCYLEASDNIHIVRSDIKPLDTDGSIEVKTVLNNRANTAKNVELSYEVYEAEVTVENKTSEYAEDLLGATANVVESRNVTLSDIAVDTLDAKIEGVKLWTPSTPNLYVLKVTAKVDGNVLDTYYTQFGVRTLGTDGDKLLLNGELAPYLAGVGRTEDHPTKGPAMNNEEQFKDFETIKNTLKANFVRTGHFPANKTAYLYTDRLGLAVWQEIPAYWFSGEAFETQTNRGLARQMYMEMIYASYNRPSVWFNGTTNESGGQLSRVNYITDLKNAASLIDGTRLVGQSASGGDATDDSHRAADIIGMTMYQGVFTGVNAYNGTIDVLTQMHNKFPNKPILATEYGYWSSDGDTTITKQYEIFNATFNAFTKLANTKEDGTENPDGFISGGAWWCAFNWYTEITKTQTMGLIHMDRVTPKEPLTSIFAEKYNRYTKVSAPDAVKVSGKSTWYNSLSSNSGVTAGEGAAIKSVALEGENGAVQATEVTASKATSITVLPQGGELAATNLANYDYFNFYVKDMNGDNTISVIFTDNKGVSWEAEATAKTVKGQWTKLSVATGANIDHIDTAAVNKVTIKVPAEGKYYFNKLYFSTYINDTIPQVTPAGASIWYQDFENVETLEAGIGATAEIASDAALTGTRVAKLVTTQTGNPGTTKSSVIVTPKGSDVFDITDYGYMSLYVKDTQGSNTVLLVFKDKDGKIASQWTDTGSTKNTWTKVYAPLNAVKNSGIDTRNIVSIALAQWNAGTYYFDDIYFAKYPSDGPPAPGEVGGAQPTIVNISDITASIEKGGNFTLPRAVIATMSDNSTRAVDIVWTPNTVDTTKSGVFIFEGQVDGYDGKVKLTLSVIDTSDNTDETRDENVPLPDRASVTNTDTAVVISVINNVASSGSVTIDVTNNKTVAKEIFDAIKGTNKTLIFKGDVVEWTFTGKDITETTKDIDMTVRIATLNSTTSENKALIGEKINNENVLVISFANNGQLPGRAKIKLKLDNAWLANRNKNNINIYYFNEVSKAIEPVASELTADSEGYVQFYITHNSDYIISDKALTMVPVEPTIVRLGGSDRYETSIKVSQAGWKTSEFVVLARGDEYADALTAAPFAKQLNAPILLTAPKALDARVKAELIRLKAKKIYVIGGTGAISSKVVNAVSAMGIKVERICGNDRYETALAIAKKMTNKNQVFLATGTNFADALSISSYAASTGSPILLTTKNSISAEVAKFIKDNNSKVYVIGGNGVIADTVMKSIAGAERIGGNDRYATNLAILNRFAAGFEFSDIYLATGANYPDAICSSALAGSKKAPIILVNSNDTNAQNAYIKTIGSRVKEVNVIGGAGVLPAETVQNVLK